MRKVRASRSFCSRLKRLRIPEGSSYRVWMSKSRLRCFSCASEVLILDSCFQAESERKQSLLVDFHDGIKQHADTQNQQLQAGFGCPSVDAAFQIVPAY
jgi:hypothetical protein